MSGNRGGRAALIGAMALAACCALPGLLGATVLAVVAGLCSGGGLVAATGIAVGGWSAFADGAAGQARRLPAPVSAVRADGTGTADPPATAVR